MQNSPQQSIPEKRNQNRSGCLLALLAFTLFLTIRIFIANNNELGSIILGLMEGFSLSLLILSLYTYMIERLFINMKEILYKKNDKGEEVQDSEEVERRIGQINLLLLLPRIHLTRKERYDFTLAARGFLYPLIIVTVGLVTAKTFIYSPFYFMVAIVALVTTIIVNNRIEGYYKLEDLNVKVKSNE